MKKITNIIIFSLWTFIIIGLVAYATNVGIQNVNVTGGSITPVLTSIITAEESYFPAGGNMIMMGVERDDVLGSSVAYDGMATYAKTDADGAIWTHDTNCLTSSDLNFNIGGDQQVEVTNTSIAVTGTVTANTGLTDQVQYVEDDGHSSGHKGNLMLAVRNDGLSVLAGTTGDYIPLTTNSSGELIVTTSGGSSASYTIDDTANTVQQAVTGADATATVVAATMYIVECTVDTYYEWRDTAATTADSRIIANTYMQKKTGAAQTKVHLITGGAAGICTFTPFTQ